jgi:hypothetical protein
MTLTHPFGVPAGATQMEFSITNLVIPGWPHVGSPLVIDVPGYRVTLKPLEDYEGTAQQLLRTSGTLRTAEAEIWPRPYGPITSRFAKATLDDVSSGLTLATGTKVSWISYRIGDRRVGHRSSVTKEFSATLHNLEWVLDLASAVPANMKNKDRAFVREMIDYFTDVTAPELFLETRSLTASTLLDALTNRYSRRVGYETYIKGTAWKKLRARLVDAIDAESTKFGLAGTLSGHVDNLRRYSFKERLVRLLDDKGLLHPDLDELTKVRNDLVHTGHFSGANHFESFKLLLWVSFAVLAKLADYPGAIKPIQARIFLDCLGKGPMLQFGCSVDLHSQMF